MPRKTARDGDEQTATLDPITQALCDEVRRLRKLRGWSLDELSAASGVSRSMLNQIERGRVNPTLAVAHRIAQAFKLSLGRMLDTENSATNIEVIRADDRQYHYRSDRYCRIRTLSPLHLEKDVEFYELTLRPKGRLRSSAHYQGTREFLTIQQGQVQVTSGDDTVNLKQGDSAQYAADIQHAIENSGENDAIAFLVVIYQSR